MSPSLIWLNACQMALKRHGIWQQPLWPFHFKIYFYLTALLLLSLLSRDKGPKRIKPGRAVLGQAYPTPLSRLYRVGFRRYFLGGRASLPYLLPCRGCPALDVGTKMDSGVNLTVVTSSQRLRPRSFDWLLSLPSPVSERKLLSLSRGLPGPCAQGPCRSCRLSC